MVDKDGICGQGFGKEEEAWLLFDRLCMGHGEGRCRDCDSTENFLRCRQVHMVGMVVGERDLVMKSRKSFLLDLLVDLLFT